MGLDMDVDAGMYMDVGMEMEMGRNDIKQAN
jgi:hypothetical protein